MLMDMYRALGDVNPNVCNRIVTLMNGETAEDKCLLSEDKLIWSQVENGFFAEHLDEVSQITNNGMAQVAGRTVYCEVLGREKKVVICGGGHISMPLIKMSLMLGMQVTVLEDRPLFAGNAREAGATDVRCDSFTNALQEIPGDADTFFIIVTRGHRYDKECLNAISRKPHAYIGMIGSKRRVAMVKQSLIEEEGCDPEVINSVYTPIGLNIGAETPEEIAVAIMAQLISVKSASGRNSVYPRDMMRAIMGDEAGLPKLLCTIIERKGSAPRDVGAKMLILSDGTTIGTIGGGCVEGDVLRRARTFLKQEDFTTLIIDVDMTAEAADDEGMVCGGTVKLLLEKI